MNLAHNLRPVDLEDFIGQEHLIGNGKVISRMIDSGQIYSIILWGPPGCGKTTLARIIAEKSGSKFYYLSGVTAGKKDLLDIVSDAKKDLENNKRTILFIDEIHRWNKSQQDTLLPYVESGEIILIGATTENPSFEVISPLLSRMRVFVLNGLSYEDLDKILSKALDNKKIFSKKPVLDKEARELLIRLSGADARVMLNALEIVTKTFGYKISGQEILEVFQSRSQSIYDKKADEHYNTISAFIKSMRASDVDASLYYLAKMLESGEEPKFIARRLIIFASEDIGLADRGALIQANAGFEAVTKIGMPESQLILAHICIYLSLAKKSRACTNALGLAKRAVQDYPNATTPLHLRNAPTKLMKDLGYAKDYKWSEKYVGPTTTKSNLPEEIKNKKFYNPES